MKTTLILLAAEAGRYDNMTFADRVSESLKVSLLGMATVFAVLALLWGVLEVFRYFFYDLRQKNKDNGGEDKTADVKSETVVAAAPDTNVSDDEEIVAAITAAVSVVMNKNANSFRVVSFRRSGTR